MTKHVAQWMKKKIEKVVDVFLFCDIVIGVESERIYKV